MITKGEICADGACEFIGQHLHKLSLRWFKA